MHDVDGEMHHAYDAELASVYLVRPDGYVGFRADWAARHLVLEFLETYLVATRLDASASTREPIVGS